MANGPSSLQSQGFGGLADGRRVYIGRLHTLSVKPVVPVGTYEQLASLLYLRPRVPVAIQGVGVPGAPNFTTPGARRNCDQLRLPKTPV